MKRNLSLDLSILALSALTALIAPSSAVLGSSACSSAASSFVTSSIKADTISVAAGTEVPLYISVENAGTEAIKNGSVVIIVAREPRQGDFSQGNYFIVTRSVVKTGVNIEANSNAKFSFAWSIPAHMPEGVYKADAILLQDGKVLEDAVLPSNNPFGNGTKLLISGDAPGALFFVAEPVGDDSGGPNIAFFNGTKDEVEVPVIIRVYSGGLDGDLVRSESVSVSTKAGSLHVLPYDTSGIAKPFSLTAETIYKGVPAFYMYSSGGAADNCSDKSMVYLWATLIGGLGVIMLLLALLKERRS